MYSKLLKKIKEYDCIAIFHHARPDGDCFYSALAIYEFLKDNFKDKKIKFCGFDKYEKINKFEKVSDSFIKKSLAIIVDTSNANRVDDLRFKLASYIIKIDHHPVVDSYGDLNIEEPQCAACAEIIAKILMSKSFNKYHISNKVYEYLYSGIVTDTINYSVTSTTADTLNIASKLVEKGNLKISDIVSYLMDLESNTYQQVTKLRNYLKIKKNFGYVILTEKQAKSLNMEPLEAKNHINEFTSISNLNIFAFAVQNGRKYDVSIRSKRGYIINKISQEYGGGGHANATGIRQITKAQVNDLFHRLIEMSTKKAKIQ